MAQISRGQLFEVAFWFAFAAAAYALSLQFDRPMDMYRFGATAWPRAIILLIVLAAIGQLYDDLRRTRPVSWAAAKPVQLPDDLAGRSGEYYVRMGMVFGLPLAYTFLLEYTGYYLTTPFLLIGYFFAYGEYRIRRILVLTIAIYVVITVVFTTIFYTGLPVGNWPVFYDINNWILLLFR